MQLENHTVLNHNTRVRVVCKVHSAVVLVYLVPDAGISTPVCGSVGHSAVPQETHAKQVKDTALL